MCVQGLICGFGQYVCLQAMFDMCYQYLFNVSYPQIYTYICYVILKYVLLYSVLPYVFYGTYYVHYMNYHSGPNEIIYKYSLLSIHGTQREVFSAVVCGDNTLTMDIFK